jgi:hypothetical protein
LKKWTHLKRDCGEGRVRTPHLPEGFLPSGFLTDIVIVIGHARAHGVLFEAGALFEPTIPTHDSRVSHDFSST